MTQFIEPQSQVTVLIAPHDDQSALVATKNGATAESDKSKKRRRKKTDLPPTHPALVKLTLIDAKQFAVARGVSLSRLYELVRVGEAPQPDLREPRCVRWRLGTIETYLEGLATAGTAA